MNHNYGYERVSYAESPYGTLSQFMTKTFGWMFAGLMVSFLMALVTVTTPLINILASGLFLVVTIAELVMVFVLSARITKLQPGTATALFFGYAVLNGVTLSYYFIAYDVGTLVLAFMLGAVYFGVMAVYGMTTHRDLSGWGPKLLGGLVALIVAGVLGSVLSLFGFSFGAMDFVYCAIALALFMALTAYDTQKLKSYYAHFGGDAAMLQKSSILGALSLYLDFINIFLQILRILGRNKD